MPPAGSPVIPSTPDQSFFSPCPRGLEGVLAEELRTLGAHTTAATEGGVAFSGPFGLCYRVNLESRIASRVLWLVASGGYASERDLYDAAYQQPWPDWFSSGSTIKVKVSARHCPLKSVEFVTLRIKDAVCDRFRAAANVRPNVDTRRPDIRLDAFLEETAYSLYLDTSGEPLFKRGLRQAVTPAPLRENLAAGLLRLAGWTPDQPLLDPMCGGGTILLEAAQIGRNVAPGLGRRFAFEKLAAFDPAAWKAVCEQSRARQTPRASPAIYGSDHDPRALARARTNLEAAGLTGAVRLKQTDVLTLTPPAERGILLTNPPYGVRLGEERRLADFYPLLGTVLKQRFPGWRAYIFTADLRLPELIGLAPSRRTPLFNGALECRLYEFKLLHGSARGALRAACNTAQARKTG
jgi:putative N6-adenine-specific DNA methylase